MVWFGMIWYDLVWFSMVWFGMVWFGFVGIVWYGGGQMFLYMKRFRSWTIMDYQELS